MTKTMKELIERVNRKRRAQRLGLQVITIKGALVGRNTAGQFISLKG